MGGRRGKQEGAGGSTGDRAMESLGTGARGGYACSFISAPQFRAIPSLGPSLVFPRFFPGLSSVLPWSFLGPSLVFPRFFPGLSSVLSWSFLGSFLVFPRSFPGLSSVLPWSFLGSSLVFPGSSFFFSFPFTSSGIRNRCGSEGIPSCRSIPSSAG